MNMEIISPKRNNKDDFTNSSFLYHYYPGYSEMFVRQIIEKYCDHKASTVILDPWNGAGTTTLVASALGCTCYGYDINPSMVIVAKAKLHVPSKQEAQSFLSLVELQIQKVPSNIEIQRDPLNDWFDPRTIRILREIENSILRFCNYEKGKKEVSEDLFSDFSNKMSFYYVVMFGVLRKLCHKFFSSNPTWVKLAKNKEDKIVCNAKTIITILGDYLENIFNNVIVPIKADFPSSNIAIGNSENLPLASESIDFIITSPPYCTRIDYAVYTRIELAFLGYDKGRLRDLRHKMIGTPTITSKVFIDNEYEVGEYCKKLLDKIKGHYSKASESYYYKTYNQYFTSLSKSLKETSRVLKSGGKITIVVQDSWFKDVHVGLQQVIQEICYIHGMLLYEQYEFTANANMGYLNVNSKKYGKKPKAKETVLIFKKE